MPWPRNPDPSSPLVVAFTLKSRVAGFRTYILAGGLVPAGFATLGWHGGPLHAGETEALPELNRANAEAAILALRKQGSAVDLEDPRALLRSLFSLPPGFDQRLEAIDQASLRAAIQMMLETGDLAALTCRISDMRVECTD
jgi:hypothetical protein